MRFYYANDYRHDHILSQNKGVNGHVKPEIKVPVLVTAIQVVELLNGGTKLERILPKNQHNQRKLLNFEFGLMMNCQK